MRAIRVMLAAGRLLMILGGLAMSAQMLMPLFGTPWGELTFFAPMLPRQIGAWPLRWMTLAFCFGFCVSIAHSTPLRRSDFAGAISGTLLAIFLLKGLDAFVRSDSVHVREGLDRIAGGHDLGRPVLLATYLAGVVTAAIAIWRLRDASIAPERKLLACQGAACLLLAPLVLVEAGVARWHGWTVSWGFWWGAGALAAVMVGTHLASAALRLAVRMERDDRPEVGRGPGAR